MSRVGNKPVTVPSGVQVSLEGNRVTVKGPKGELSRTFHPDMTIAMNNGTVVVSRSSDDRSHRALHGLTRSLLAGMVEGVSKGFQKSLEIQGVGFRAQKAGDKISLQVGYTHPVEITPPRGITLTLESPTKINVAGCDKEGVGQTAAKIRAVRPPDPYRGKGIRYVGEYVRKKAGKAGKVGAKA